MSEYLTLDELTTSLDLKTEDVSLGEGKVIQVRGLTRYEYSLSLKNSINAGSVDMVRLEMNLLRFGMAQPKLTEAQAEHFMKNASAGTIDPIIKAIRRISNLGEDAEKSDVQDV